MLRLIAQQGKTASLFTRLGDFRWLATGCDRSGRRAYSTSRRLTRPRLLLPGGHRTLKADDFSKRNSGSLRIRFASTTGGLLTPHLTELLSLSFFLPVRQTPPLRLRFTATSFHPIVISSGSSCRRNLGSMRVSRVLSKKAENRIKVAASQILQNRTPVAPIVVRTR